MNSGSTLNSKQLVNASSATGLYSEQLRDALYQVGLLDDVEKWLITNSAGIVQVPQEVWARISSGYIFGRLEIRDYICEEVLQETGKSTVTRETVNSFRRGCDDILIKSGDLWKTVPSSLDNRLDELFRQRRENIHRRTRKLPQFQTKVSAGDLF